MILLELKGVHFGVVEHFANDLAAVLHTGVHRPARNGADALVLGIFVQISSVALQPRAKQQTFGFQFHVLYSCLVRWASVWPTGHAVNVTTLALSVLFETGRVLDARLLALSGGGTECDASHSETLRGW
ncbi:hypothetical protein D3C75_810510 [compost metagenome]